VAEDEDNERDDEGDVARRVRFHTTAISDLVILYLVTFGLYSVFWFYQHWSLLKRTHGLPLSPLARGLFDIFFTHRLFKGIDEGARAAGLSPAWNPGSQATTYVVLVLVSRSMLRADTDEMTALAVGLALLTASVLPLVAAQRVANLANDRPELVDEDEDEDEDEDGDEDERPRS
jgi:hypothetical protein